MRAMTGNGNSSLEVESYDWMWKVTSDWKWKVMAGRGKSHQAAYGSCDWKWNGMARNE